jgi:MFS family permease
MTGASRYRWVVLAVAVLVHATCIALIWQAVPPLKGAIGPDLGTDWERAVIIYAAFSFGMLFTQLPGGALGDRYPVRYVVGAGAILAGLATAVRFALPTLGGQVVVSVVATLGMGMVNPNLIKVVTDWFPAGQLGLGQGILMAGNTFGSGIALSLSGGVLLAAMGSWQAIFALYGLLTVAAGLLWVLFVRSPDPDERPMDPETGMPFALREDVPLRESLSAVFRAPSTKWTVALAGLSFWAIIGSLSVLPEFADAQPYHVPELLLGTPLFIATLGALSIPVLSDRFGRGLALRGGVLGLSVGIAVTGFAPSLGVFTAGMVLAGYFGGGLNAMFYVLPGELADVEAAHVGTMAGVVLSLANVGSVASTLVGARVLSELGVEASALSVAIPCLLGLFLVSKLRLQETGSTAPGTDATVEGVDD